MKKIIPTLLILLIILSSACTNKEVFYYNYTFTGENENWTAESHVTAKDTFTKEGNNYTNFERTSSRSLTITYKNDLSDLSSAKYVEISYKSSAGGGKQVYNSAEGYRVDTKTFKFSSSGNGAIENEDEVIFVTITIDGKIETIELSNSKDY